MKKALLILAFNIFGILIALMAIEIGFRLFSNSKPNQWSDRPKSYYIAENSKTFQDYSYETQKPANVFRIAVIGDSFTFAPYMQFDDAFPKKMERMLNLNHQDKKVEVINYGVPAYSTSHEVPVVEKAIQEGADFILMQITFNDPEIKPYTPQQLYREKNRFGELVLEGKIYHYWTSLAFVLKRLHNNETHKNYVQKFFNLFEKPKTWANFSNSWKKIAEASKRSNTPIAAVVFPLFGIPLDGAYPFHPIHVKVRDLLKELGIRGLDLFTVYQGIPLERLQVIVGQDFHPNEIGHRMAAEAIVEWLGKEKLIPVEYVPKVTSSERIGIRKPGEKENAPALREDVTNDEGESQ